MARGAIDLHEVAQPKILDPRGVEGSIRALPFLEFQACALAGPRQCGNRFNATKASATVFR
jgi:hypothetical protein